MPKLERFRPFMTVVDGRMECHLGSGGLDKAPAKFDLTPEGEEALAKFYAELEGFGPEGGVQCSSSCDFPEDDGAPEGFDCRAFIGRALDRAYVLQGAS